MKERFYRLLNLLFNRIWIITILLGLAFFLLWISLYRLQILNTDTYEEITRANVVEERVVKGPRGHIYDRNGVPLTQNREVHSLYYTPDASNESLNEALLYLISLLKAEGLSITPQEPFPIAYSESGGYYYIDRYKAAYNEIAHDNFLAELYNTSRSELTEEQKKTIAYEAYLLAKDSLFELPEGLSREEIFDLLTLRYTIYSGRFDPQTPVEIAYQISSETEARILERGKLFDGFSVQKSYERYYPQGELFAHIVGYTGKVTYEELENLEISENPYDIRDEIGKTGLELSFESLLRGKDGLMRIEVDSSTGLRVNETTLSSASSGSDLYLTIDIELQKKAYEELASQIKAILLSKITGEKGEKGSSYDEMQVLSALLENHFVTISEIEAMDSAEAAEIRAAYEKESSALSDLMIREINTPLENYPPYLEALYNLMIENMRNHQRLSYDYQKDEDFYEGYRLGYVSPRDFFTYCLEHRLIRQETYQFDTKATLPTRISTLIRWELESLFETPSHKQIVYPYLLENRSVSAGSFLTLLYDLQKLPKGSIYSQFESGSLSPLETIIQNIEQDYLTPSDIHLDPCSGSVVISDPSSGEVLAMASYPSYDPNRFIHEDDYFYQVIENQSGPLSFRALDEQRAIGSTYKMCTALCALDLGYITRDTLIRDSYAFPYANSVDKPHCWSVVSHGDINVVEALNRSCNYFFYECGYRLSDPTPDHKFEDRVGLSKLRSYAEKLGLATKTGIEISESTPFASDIDAVRSSIGQGNNAFSAANLNRYTNTIANNGTVYDLYLVKAVYSGQGELLMETKPKGVSAEIDESLFSIVKEGMRLMVTDEQKHELSILDENGIHCAGKTGTAEEQKDRQDHSLFTGYTNFLDPDITITLFIPFGGGSRNVMEPFRNLAAYYYGVKLP